jgi:hypothetical protein
LSLFDERNSGLRRSEEPVLDLHGLHVNEGTPSWVSLGLPPHAHALMMPFGHRPLLPALAFLETTLASLRAQRHRGAVYVITGTGHHSAGGRARLAPAVQAWLLEAGLVPRDASTDRRGGMLVVTLA